jgi:hypothetical protein
MTCPRRQQESSAPQKIQGAPAGGATNADPRRDMSDRVARIDSVAPQAQCAQHELC